MNTNYAKPMTGINNSVQPEIMIKKFGGTSVGSIERIEAVANRIAKDSANKKQVVVVSAMSGETNRLIQMARLMNPSYKGLAYDMLLASGEQVSVALLAMALEKKNIKALPLLAHQVGIKTNEIFSRARIQSIDTKLLKQHLNSANVLLIAGFQGVTDQNKITTLGRGGSDTTATALSAALQQPSCEIFTDVPKVYTADPRIIANCRQISYLSFEEMMEMSSLGSRVLHSRSVEIAAKFKIKIHVRSTFEEGEGTWIVPKEELMENPIVSAVTHDLQTVIIKMFPIPKGLDFISTLFSKLAEQSISIDVISQSQLEKGQRLAFSIKSEDLEDTRSIIFDFIDEKQVSIIEDTAKLSIVGVGMAGHPGVASRFFSVLNNLNIDLHLVTTSEIKVSAIIDKKHLSSAAKALHDEFQLGAHSTG